ncbi:MAG: cytochrome c oxidase subunit CcoM [Marinobacter sp.]|uniref:cytochrome c oxidase subunit CcoM n=1 Tax=Marinobacter sp. TaxID=50741 RepID=UPI003F9E9D3E
MYMDAVVFAGIAVVLLVLVFFVAVGVFVVRDQKNYEERQIRRNLSMEDKAA